MLKVAFVGYRGLVGSVLINSMLANNNFNKISSYFFSTSMQDTMTPFSFAKNEKILDAYNIDLLSSCDVIVSCQGSNYTNNIIKKLRDIGYNGFWLDSSSALRMEEDNVIVLDPVNRGVIDEGLKNNIKNYSVGNCTVSLMLLAICGLIKENLVESIINSSYQAASGAGTNYIKEFLLQTNNFSKKIDNVLNKENNVLSIMNTATNIINSEEMPKEYYKNSLYANVLPWIDTQYPNGQTKEEHKGIAETNKILGFKENTIQVDSTCVRVGVLRCHSQSLAIKLKQKLTLKQITDLLKNAHEWIKLIDNNQNDTIKYLNPAYVSSTLDIAVGRIRPMIVDENYISLFTVGDQLLWGASEPLRRMLNILIECK